jgi:PAS domain-containing protein
VAPIVQPETGRRAAPARQRREQHPQGLVLYDASARIIACNQPYMEMFGLSPEVVKPRCTMQQLAGHRKETGSFDGDVDEFCNAIIRTVWAASDMSTTAEGVETEQQQNLLCILGCTEMQGYLFSPAISAMELRHLLLSHRGRVMSTA